MEISSKAELDSALNSEKAVIIYFYATWCTMCRMQKPILKIIERDMADQVDVVRVDVDQNKDLEEAYGVTGMPTSFLFKQGKEIARHAGVLTKEKLVEFIQSE